MDFHEMKRRDLQALCKKHGIPANLKNTEMATRLASLLQKESEIVNVSSDDSVEVDDAKAKKVSFSPEAEVFEFTSSVKRPRQRKNRSQGSVPDFRQESIIELRRSKRIGSSDVSKEVSGGSDQYGSKVEIVGRRSTRRAAKVPKSSQRVLTEDKEDVQDDAKVEEVSRRSKRFANDIDGESKEERKSKQLKGSVNSEEGETLVDCEVELVPRRSKRHLNKVELPLVDEEQVRVKCTRKYTKKGSLKEDVTLVKPSEKVTRGMKRDVSGELTSEEHLIGQEEVSGANVEAKGSSKKSKTMSQECIESIAQGRIEKSPSSSETRAGDSVTVIENVLDSTLEKSVDSAQKANSRESDPELSVAMLAEEAECLKESHSSQEGEKGLEESGQVEAEEERDGNEEARGSSKKTHTVNQESVKDKRQGTAEEDSPSTYETKVTEPVTILENVLDSTLEVPGDTSRVRSTQELNSQLMERECEDKREQDSVLIAGTEEHGSVSKLAKAILETHSNNNDEKGSLQKDLQETNPSRSFFECNTENTIAEEQAAKRKVSSISGGECVNLQTLGKIKDASLEKSEDGDAEMSGWSSPNFASPFTKEENISECFEKEETKALSQPCSALDESAVFTTPERNLLLMEQISEKGKACEADSKTHQKDEAVEICPEQVLLMGDARIDKAGKEEDHTPLNIPDTTNSLLGGSGNHKAQSVGDSIAVELRNRYALLETSVPDVVERSGGWVRINNADKLSLCTSLEKQLSYGGSEHKKEDQPGQERVRIGKEFMPETSKQSRAHSPHIDSETVNDTEINVSYVLALPAKGTSDTSNYLGVVGTIIAETGLEDEAIATASAEEETIKSGDTTPSPEQMLDLNIGGPSVLSEEEVKREPISIYTTQVKPKRPHDMKENAPYSKIVDNLNVTAPRTSKRQPLQDLRKN